MTVGIMQPYFLPYIGYYQLINTVDTFVVYDNIEYTKKGWINRNKILCNNDEKLFSIPVKADSDYLNINERFLADNALKQRKKIVAQIYNSYRKAAFFDDVYPLIEKLFLFNNLNLFEFIFNALKETCKFLDINTTFVMSSHLNIDVTLKGQNKVLAICKELQTKTYINAIGGQSLYDKMAFKNQGTKLYFLKTGDINYKQFSQSFIPFLSIIDVLMFNSKTEIKRMLNEFELI